MDEVTAFPNNMQESYLTSIYDRCHMDGLKLIINTGNKDFNYSFYSNVCDYILTDEAYMGGNPSSSEIRIGLSRCLVTNNACSSSANATSYTEIAWSKGFGWAWCTDSNQYNLPSYLTTYISGIEANTETTTTAP